MDRASSGKLILLRFKQNQIALFDVQRLPYSEVIAITHSEVNAIACSEPEFDFLIVINSEYTIAITSE
jgi:hypothetical protein